MSDTEKDLIAGMNLVKLFQLLIEIDKEELERKNIKTNRGGALDSGKYACCICDSVENARLFELND